MRIAKKTLKYVLYFLLVPIVYLVISLILTIITINRDKKIQNFDKTIYLNTNGVHLDIILPKNNIDSLVLFGIKHFETENYLAFGWGDENFYINTPTWTDLTIKNAFKAMFLKSPTLVHITRYNDMHENWVEIKVNDTELKKLNAYLLKTFKTDLNGMKIILENKGYSLSDDFYKAKGSYSCFNTCNSWVNTGFKESGLKACFWTPFDFGLLNKYK
ncbi:MAG: DUF2459 domain-containing protein [Aestuariibaculum sp.]